MKFYFSKTPEKKLFLFQNGEIPLHEQIKKEATDMKEYLEGNMSPEEIKKQTQELEALLEKASKEWNMTLTDLENFMENGGIKLNIPKEAEEALDHLKKILNEIGLLTTKEGNINTSAFSVKETEAFIKIKEKYATVRSFEEISIDNNLEKNFPEYGKFKKMHDEEIKAISEGKTGWAVDQWKANNNIEPKKSLTLENGKNISLKESMQKALATFDIKNTEELKNAFSLGQKYAPNLIKNIPQDADCNTLVQIIKSINSPNYSPTKSDIENIQKIYSFVSPELAQTFAQHGENEGVDGKWGFATIEATLKLATVLKDAIKIESSQDLVLQTPEPPKEIVDVLKNKENIILLIDNTGSMRDHVQNLIPFLDNVIKNNPRAKIDLRFFDDDGLLGHGGFFRAEEYTSIREKLSNIITGGGADEPENGLLAVRQILNFNGNRPFPEKSHEGPNKNAILVFTDAPFKGVTENLINEIREQSQKQGVDIQFVKSNPNDKTGHSVTFNQYAEDWKNLGKRNIMGVVPTEKNKISLDITKNETK